MGSLKAPPHGALPLVKLHLLKSYQPFKIEPSSRDQMFKHTELMGDFSHPNHEGFVPFKHTLYGTHASADCLHSGLYEMCVSLFCVVFEAGLQLSIFLILLGSDACTSMANLFCIGSFSLLYTVGFSFSMVSLTCSKVSVV